MEQFQESDSSFETDTSKQCSGITLPSSSMICICGSNHTSISCASVPKIFRDDSPTHDEPKKETIFQKLMDNAKYIFSYKSGKMCQSQSRQPEVFEQEITYSSKPICTCDKSKEVLSRGDTRAVSKRTCTNNNCTSKLNQTEIGLNTIPSDKLDIMKTLTELGTKEKLMKHQIEQLQTREKTYKDVLKTFETKFSPQTEMKSCTCQQSNIQDELIKISNELKLENKTLKNELLEMKMELKHCLDRIEGPMLNNLETEKCKCMQLKEELSHQSQNMMVNQDTYMREMNSLKMQLCLACSNMAELNSINTKLKSELRSLDAMCAKLEDDLVKQKLNEAETLRLLSRRKGVVPIEEPVKIAKPQPEKCDENLHAIARKLSRTLKESAPCEECAKLPAELAGAAKCIKDLTDMVISRKVTVPEVQFKHPSGQSLPDVEPITSCNSKFCPAKATSTVMSQNVHECNEPVKLDPNSNIMTSAEVTSTDKEPINTVISSLDNDASFKSCTLESIPNNTPSADYLSAHSSVGTPKDVLNVEFVNSPFENEPHISKNNIDQPRDWIIEIPSNQEILENPPIIPKNLKIIAAQSGSNEPVASANEINLGVLEIPTISQRSKDFDATDHISNNREIETPRNFDQRQRFFESPIAPGYSETINATDHISNDHDIETPRNFDQNERFFESPIAPRYSDNESEVPNDYYVTTTQVNQRFFEKIDATNEFPYDVVIETEPLTEFPNDLYTTTTITNQGILEVVTESPPGIITTTITITPEGRIVVHTKISETDFETGSGIKFSPTGYESTPKRKSQEITVDSYYPENLLIDGSQLEDSLFATNEHAEKRSIDGYLEDLLINTPQLQGTVFEITQQIERPSLEGHPEDLLINMSQLEDSVFEREQQVERPSLEGHPEDLLISTSQLEDSVFERDQQVERPSLEGHPEDLLISTSQLEDSVFERDQQVERPSLEGHPEDLLISTSQLEDSVFERVQQVERPSLEGHPEDLLISTSQLEDSVFERDQQVERPSLEGHPEDLLISTSQLEDSVFERDQQVERPSLEGHPEDLLISTSQLEDSVFERDQQVERPSLEGHPEDLLISTSQLEDSVFERDQQVERPSLEGHPEDLLISTSQLEDSVFERDPQVERPSLEGHPEDLLISTSQLEDSVFERDQQVERPSLEGHPEDLLINTSQLEDSVFETDQHVVRPSLEGHPEDLLINTSQLEDSVFETNEHIEEQSLSSYPEALLLEKSELEDLEHMKDIKKSDDEIRLSDTIDEPLIVEEIIDESSVIVEEPITETEKNPEIVEEPTSEVEIEETSEIIEQPIIEGKTIEETIEIVEELAQEFLEQDALPEKIEEFKSLEPIKVISETIVLEDTSCHKKSCQCKNVTLEDKETITSNTEFKTTTTMVSLTTSEKQSSQEDLEIDQGLIIVPINEDKEEMPMSITTDKMQISQPSASSLSIDDVTKSIKSEISPPTELKIPRKKHSKKPKCDCPEICECVVCSPEILKKRKQSLLKSKQSEKKDVSPKYSNAGEQKDIPTEQFENESIKKKTSSLKNFSQHSSKTSFKKDSVISRKNIVVKVEKINENGENIISTSLENVASGNISQKSAIKEVIEQQISPKPSLKKTIEKGQLSVKPKLSVESRKYVRCCCLPPNTKKEFCECTSICNIPEKNLINESKTSFKSVSSKCDCVECKCPGKNILPTNVPSRSSYKSLSPDCDCTKCNCYAGTSYSVDNRKLPKTLSNQGCKVLPKLVSHPNNCQCDTCSCGRSVFEFFAKQMPKECPVSRTGHGSDCNCATCACILKSVTEIAQTKEFPISKDNKQVFQVTPCICENYQAAKKILERSKIPIRKKPSNTIKPTTKPDDCTCIECKCPLAAKSSTGKPDDCTCVECKCPNSGIINKEKQVERSSSPIFLENCSCSSCSCQPDLNQAVIYEEDSECDCRECDCADPQICKCDATIQTEVVCTCDECECEDVYEDCMTNLDLAMDALPVSKVSSKHDKNCTCVKCACIDCEFDKNKNKSVLNHPPDCTCSVCNCSPSKSSQVPSKIRVGDDTNKQTFIDRPTQVPSHLTTSTNFLTCTCPICKCPPSDVPSSRTANESHPLCDCKLCKCNPCNDTSVKPVPSQSSVNSHIPECSCSVCQCPPNEGTARNDVTVTHPPGCKCDKCICNPCSHGDSKVSTHPPGCKCNKCICSPCSHDDSKMSTHPPGCKCDKCVCSPCSHGENKMPTHPPGCKCDKCICSPCLIGENETPTHLVGCKCDKCLCSPCSHGDTKLSTHPPGCKCAKCVCDPCLPSGKIEIKASTHPPGCDCNECKCTPCKTPGVQIQGQPEVRTIGDHPKDQSKPLANIETHSEDCTCEICRCPSQQTAIQPVTSNKEHKDHSDDCNCEVCWCPSRQTSIQPVASNQFHSGDCKCPNCQCPSGKKTLENNLIKSDMAPSKPIITLQQKSITFERAPDCKCVECKCNPCAVPVPASVLSQLKNSDNVVEKSSTKYQPHSKSCVCSDCICVSCVKDQKGSPTATIDNSPLKSTPLINIIKPKSQYCSCVVCNCDVCVDKLDSTPQQEEQEQHQPTVASKVSVNTLLDSKIFLKNCTCTECKCDQCVKSGRGDVKAVTSQTKIGVEEVPSVGFNLTTSKLCECGNCECVICSKKMKGTTKPTTTTSSVVAETCDCDDCKCVVCSKKQNEAVQPTTTSSFNATKICDCGDCKCVVCSKKQNETVQPTTTSSFNTTKICDCGDCKCVVCSNKQGGLIQPLETSPSNVTKICDCGDCKCPICTKKQSLSVQPTATTAEKQASVPQTSAVETFAFSQRLHCNCPTCTCVVCEQSLGSSKKVKPHNDQSQIAKDNCLCNQETDEIIKLLSKIKCACMEAEMKAFKTGALSNSKPQNFEATMSGLKMALTNLQQKCKEKDKMIASMKHELKKFNKGNTLKNIPSIKVVDYDRGEDVPLIGRYKNNKYGHCKCSDKADKHISKKKHCKCANKSTKLDLKGFEIIDIRRVTEDSLLVKWNPPKCGTIIGYDIFVNGVNKSKVLSSSRTNAMVHNLTFNQPLEITVYAVLEHGRCEPPAIAIFEI